MQLDGLNTETDLDFNQPLDAALQQAVWRYEETLKDLRGGAESLIRRLQDAIEQCDLALRGEAFAINSCGLVQGLGTEIDRGCAALAIRGEQLRTLLYLRRQPAESKR